MLKNIKLISQVSQIRPVRVFTNCLSLPIMLSLIIALNGCGEKEILDYRHTEIVNDVVYAKEANMPFTGEVTNYPATRIFANAASYFEHLPSPSGDSIYEFDSVVQVLEGFLAFGSASPIYSHCTVSVKNGVLQGRVQCQGTQNGEELRAKLNSEGQLDGELLLSTPSAKPLLQANFKDGIPDGKLQLYYANGDLQISATLKNGFAVKRFERIYANGNTHQRFNLNDAGNYDGVQHFYFANGQLALDLQYSNGLRNGYLKAYYSNGQLKEDSFYKEQQLHNAHRVYAENGNLCVLITYDTGIKQGPYEIYDKKTGCRQLQEKGEYENNKRTSYQRYSTNNILLEEVQIDKAKQTSTTKIYYPDNGAIKSIEVKKQDLQGKYQFELSQHYAANGNLCNSTTYSLGVKNGSYELRYPSYITAHTCSQLQEKGEYSNGKRISYEKYSLENILLEVLDTDPTQQTVTQKIYSPNNGSIESLLIMSLDQNHTYEHCEYSIDGKRWRIFANERGADALCLSMTRYAHNVPNPAAISRAITNPKEYIITVNSDTGSAAVFYSRDLPNFWKDPYPRHQFPNGTIIPEIKGNDLENGTLSICFNHRESNGKGKFYSWVVTAKDTFCAGDGEKYLINAVDIQILPVNSAVPIENANVQTVASGNMANPEKPTERRVMSIVVTSSRDGYVNLREGPGTHFPVKLTQTNNVKLEVIDTQKNWYYVRGIEQPDVIGYVHKSQVRQIEN